MTTYRPSLAYKICFFLASLVFVMAPLHYFLDHADQRPAPMHREADDYLTAYSSTRCLIDGCNPYDSFTINRAFFEKNNTEDSRRSFWRHSLGPHSMDNAFSWTLHNANYPVTSLGLLVPFALFAWRWSLLLWYVTSAALFIAAAWYTGELCASPENLASWLLLLMLATSQHVLAVGQPSCIAVALCVLGTFSLLTGRRPLAGNVCFAISLVLKPQIGAFVWLYFLLANKTYRRRSLIIAATAAALCIPGLLLAAAHPASAHWLRDFLANLKDISAPGQLSDPSRFNPDSTSLINLQVVIGSLRDSHKIQDLVAHTVGALMLLAWGVVTLRTPDSRTKDIFALAAISALSLLPIYHRNYDTTLLLITFPALSLLVAERSQLITSVVAATLGVEVLLSFYTLPINLLYLDDELSLHKFQLLIYHLLACLVLFLACLYLAVYLLRARKGFAPASA